MKIFIIVFLLSIGSLISKGYAAEVKSNKENNLVVELFNTIIDSRIWNLDSSGFSRNESNPFDRFGESLSHGDYNEDGWQDLAIGIPNYDFLGLISNTGTVLILYGTANGLSNDNHQYLFQTFETDPPNLENINGIESNEFFDTGLASGDFNCDGYTDLAVGKPSEIVTLSAELRNNVGVRNIM